MRLHRESRTIHNTQQKEIRALYFDLRVLFISVKGMNLYLTYVRSPELSGIVFPLYSRGLLVPFYGALLWFDP